jgi:hypothetical protein
LAYIRAASLDQTFDRLAEHGDEALAAIAVATARGREGPKSAPGLEMTSSAARCTGR